MEYVELVNKEEFRKQVEEEILEAKDEGYDKIVDKISSDILVLNEQLKAEYEAVQECDKKIYNVTEELAKLKNTGSSEVDKLKIELSQLELSRLELSNVWSQDNDKLKNLSLDLDYHNGKIQFDDYYNKYSINHREHYELNKSNNDRIFKKQLEVLFSNVELSMNMLQKTQSVPSEVKNIEQNKLNQYVYDLEAFITNMADGDIKNQAKDRYMKLISKQSNKEVHTESVNNENNKTVELEQVEEKQETEKDYTRLIAAQNESKRRLNIKKITKAISEEHKKKNLFALATGTCLAGLIASIHFSGVDPQQALQTEVQALNSFESLKEYFATFTPAMWMTMIGTAASFSNFIKHKEKYKTADSEFYDMINNQPEDYQDIVETQARHR